MVNPYHDWLEIPRSIPQPDYYQLLGFTKEDYKIDLLDQYYFERFECVRRFEQSQGIYGELAQSLLAELSKARETLRDGEARRYYDESLRQSRAEESTKNAAAEGGASAERVSSGMRSERVSPGTSSAQGSSGMRSEQVREKPSQSSPPRYEQSEIAEATAGDPLPRLSKRGMALAYHDWLNIPRSVPQPDYYQLLGLSKDDYKRELLESYYSSRFELVRKYENGQYAELAQMLLRELSQAYTTLQDEAARRAYDERLRRSRAEASEKRIVAAEDTIADRVSSGTSAEQGSSGTSSERVRENSFQSATPQHEQQEIIDAIVVERIPRLANQIPTNPMSAMIAEASGQPWAETLSDAERVPTSAAAVRHPAEDRHAAWPIERQAGSATIPLRSTSSGSVATPGSSPFAPLNDSQGETGERDGGALAELGNPFSASDVGLGSGNWVTRMIMMWTMLMLLWLAFVVVAGLLLQITGVFCLIVGIVWFLYGCASALARTTSLGTNRRPSQSTNSLVGGVSTVAVALLLISLGQWSWRIQSRQSAEEVARREQVVQAIEEALLAIEQNKMAKAIELVDQVRLLADPTEQRVINIIRHVSQLSLVTARRDASNADIRQILIEGRAFLAGKETLRAKERLQEVLAIEHAPGHPDVIKFADEIVLMHVEDAENHLQASSFNQARLSAEEALRVPGTNLKKIAQRMLQRVNEQEAAYGRRGGFE